MPGHSRSASPLAQRRRRFEALRPAATLGSVDPHRARIWPEGLQPYAVARSGLAERGSHSLIQVDPTHTSSAPFLRSLERLDRLIYSPSGMATPRWAFYDCAELPGVVFGLCAPAEQLPDEARRALTAAGHEGYVPLSAVVAIPTVEADHWLVYAVCELGEVMATGFPDQRAETLRSALAWLGAREASAVCQWSGDRVAMHLSCAELELRAAWMPSHDRPATCCLHYAMATPGPAPSGRRVWISGVDEAALLDLQSKIETGRRYWIVDARRGAAGPEFALREKSPS